MATPRELLTERLKLALEETRPGMTPEVVPAADPRFGDYQSNVAMVLAKINKTAPRSRCRADLAAIWMSRIFANRLRWRAPDLSISG